MSKYNFNEIKEGDKVYYGEYTPEKQRYLRSAADQYAKRHNWGQFITRKCRETNRLMLIRLG